MPLALLAGTALAPMAAVADTTLGTASADGQAQLDALGALTFTNGTLSLTQAGAYAFGAGATLTPGTQNVIAATASTALALGAADPLTIDGGRLTVDVAANTQSTLSGSLVLANDGVLAKTGSGVLTLDGTVTTPVGASADSIDGTGVRIQGGTLRLVQDQALAGVNLSTSIIDTTLDFGSTTQTLTGDFQGITLSGSGRLRLVSSGGMHAYADLANAQVEVSGNVTFINGRVGGLFVNGGTYNYTFGTFIGSLGGIGTINAGSTISAGVMSIQQGLTINAGAVFATSAFLRSNSYHGILFTGDLTLQDAEAAIGMSLQFSNGALVDLGGVSQTLNVANAAGGIDLHAAGTALNINMTGGAGAALSILSLEGNGATVLQKTGAGLLDIDGTNVSGLAGVDVRQDTFRIGGHLAGPLSVDVATGATLSVSGQVDALSVNGTGSVVVDGEATLTNLAGSLQSLGGSGVVHLAADATFGSNFGLTGVLDVGAGTTTTLTTTNALAGSSQVIVNGMLDLGGFDQSLAQLSGSGVLGNPGSVLTLVGGTSSTYSGAITGSGATVLQKTGAGTLTLSGSDLSGIGSVSLLGGRLAVTGTWSLPSTAVPDLAIGTTFDLGSGQQQFAGFTGSGTVNVDTGGTLVLAPGTGNTRALDVALTGGGSLSVADGTLALNVATTLGGTVAVAGGARLDLLADEALAGTAGVDVASGATLNLGGRPQTLGALSGAGHVDADLAALTLNVAGGSASFAGNLTGSYALTKTGVGTQVLDGPTGTLTALTVAAGTLRFGQSGALSVATAVSVDAGATLDLAATTQTVGGIDGSGRVSIDAGGSLTLASNAADRVLNVALSGAGGFQIDGVGLHLQAPLALSGPVSIRPGASLTLDADEALAASSGVTVGSSATLYVHGTQTLRGLAGSGDVIVDGLLRLDPGAGNALTTAVQMQGYDVSGDLNGSLYIASGDVRLSGATSVFAGTAGIASGATLELVSDLALLAFGGVDIAGGGRLIARGSQLLAGLRGNGTLQIGHQGSAGYVPGELLYESDTDAVFDGTLTGAGSTLEKQGSGQLRLNGDASGLTGPASVYEGRLSINGSYGGSVTVYDGGRLGGNGTILGAVEVAEGGMLDPGNSIGTLRVGSLTLQPGAVLRVEADSVGNTDAIVATGDITIDGATLQLVPIDGTLGAGISYTVLSAGGSVYGRFAAVTSTLPLLGLSATYLPNSAGFGLDGGAGVQGIRVRIPTPNENAAISPVDPVAGGPAGLLQRMTSADADTGFWSEPQMPGIDNGEAGVGIHLGRFRADGYSQRWESFPLQYAWKLDNGAVALLSLPIANIDTDGRGRNLRLRSIAPGAGLRIPLADGWQIKPVLRWGTVVDDDYAHVGSLASATLSSHYVSGSAEGLRFGMDNLVGLYRSTGGNVHGLDAGYELRETALRNSVRLEGPLDGTFLGSGARWSVWATDTRYFGDRLATPSMQEIGLSAATRVRAGTRIDQIVNLGLMVSRTEGGGHAAQLNFGYRF